MKIIKEYINSAGLTEGLTEDDRIVPLEEILTNLNDIQKRIQELDDRQVARLGELMAIALKHNVKLT